MGKIIYSFDPKTGEYLAAASAQLDPIDGTPLIPAYATTLKPPSADDGYVVAFRDDNGNVPQRGQGGSWEAVADNRGQYWDENDNPVAISDFGIELPENWRSEKSAALVEKEAIEASGINPVNFMMRFSVAEQLWIEGATNNATAQVVLYRVDDPKLTQVQLMHPSTIELVTTIVAEMANAVGITDQPSRIAEILEVVNGADERLISTSDFKNRFSPLETGALLQVRQANPAIDLILRRIDDPRLLRLDLNLPSVQAAAGAVVQALAAVGVVTDAEARLTELLA